MKCITCDKKLDASMRHALSMNSCPFCGKNIFSSEEFDFRKAINRILIKNGIEDDGMLVRITDDISSALREEFMTVEEEDDISVRQSDFEVEEDEGEDEDPPRPKKMLKRQKKVSPKQAIDSAMEAFEEDNTIRDEDDLEDEDADDVYFPEKDDPRVEALKKKAAESQRRFSKKFKSKPIERLS